MVKLIECIPNFSEGREESILRALADAARSVPGVSLLDYSADASRNRSVYTMAGTPEGIGEAAFLLTKIASERIDLRKHNGEHPRVGAADVIPFVPLNGTEMMECVALSKYVAERISRELKIPTYLYEESAVTENKKNLADIRRGGFENLSEKMKLPEWKPDFGQAVPHPSAGTTVIGARGLLIAFNVNLNTADIRIANKIAKAVRSSNGGLPFCKAIGVQLSPDTAQVSMNMTNYEFTPLYEAFNAVEAEAARHGVTVRGSELIGLCPSKAFIDSAAHYLRLENYNYGKQVLEVLCGSL